MAPLKPHWKQPSHPEIQEVIVNDAEFTTKSVSKIALPPFGLFAKLEFPPCTVAAEPTYATVQMGRDRHLDLNSDLLYINHSCEPSLIFDMANMYVIAGPKGLRPGDELTFFYPSTEWEMAQPFDCLCGTPSCRGRIAGARDMTAEQLSGMWLNGHIRQLLEEREKAEQMQTPKQNGSAAKADVVATETGASENGTVTSSNGHYEALISTDQTVQALRDALAHAEKAVDAARLALVSYVEALHLAGIGKHGHRVFDAAQPATVEVPVGAQRRGPTSRELSGEMGGGT
ncbi:histone-lysine N-methyltransferase ash1 [Achaetomium macrosporum]|uniref:Histone-lysine N-methyltransferase ash1 n=1 Tax=Achaetomium macrosporum TaxID=79813 RepID=A0AAN7CHX2_9PEZI|nr:histone-lysine N-methyltransferase ash1 [Achaetomium macrosporum]